MPIARTLAQGLLIGNRLVRRGQERALRGAFVHVGNNFRFDPRGSYTHDTISVGNDVSIGLGAVLWAVRPSYIELRDKVMLGPNVSLIAGDHVFDIPGRYMAEIHEKRSTDDVPIVIEEDVWIGANATVLKGVTVGRGSVIAAGAVVTKTVEPYSIIAGVPGRVLRKRFTDEQIDNHERSLIEWRSLDANRWRARPYRL